MTPCNLPLSEYELKRFVEERLKETTKVLTKQGHWFLSSASRSCIGIPNTFGMESTPWHGQYSLILIALVNSAIGHSKINATEPAG